MQRLQLLKDQLYSRKLSSSQPQTNKIKEPRKPRQLPKPLTAYEYLDFDSFLTKEEILYRKSLHEFLINEIQPKMNEHNNNNSFPIELIKKISNKFPGLNTMNLKQHKEVNIPELKQMSDSLAFVCSLELFRCILIAIVTSQFKTGEEAFELFKERRDKINYGRRPRGPAYSGKPIFGSELISTYDEDLAKKLYFSRHHISSMIYQKEFLKL